MIDRHVPFEENHKYHVFNLFFEKFMPILCFSVIFTLHSPYPALLYVHPVPHLAVSCPVSAARVHINMELKPGAFL